MQATAARELLRTPRTDPLAPRARGMDPSKAPPNHSIMKNSPPPKPLLSLDDPAVVGVSDVEPIDLVAQVGSEVASALTLALERVNALTSTGKIDRSGLRSLRDEIERARRAGLMGQQVSRIASGRLRRTEERIDLTATLRQAIAQRSREMAARGIEVHQVLEPALVASDASLLFTLLQAVLDWSFEHAVAPIELGVELRTWPAEAQIVCSFHHCPTDRLETGPTPTVVASLHTMSWRLIEACARVLALRLERRDNPDRTQLTLGFPKTLLSADAVDTLLELQVDPRPLAAAQNSKPLAGSHVLVVSTRRDVRTLIRDLARPMGVMLDYVGTVDEARSFCLGGMPHAVIYEGAIGGGAMRRLMTELWAETPMLAFIEIGEQGRPFEVTNVGGREQSRVALGALAEALPQALMFELARGR